MFYYPTVLKRNSGCFSTIWLVATKGIKIPRRDYLRVNVIRTCDDIMNYVLERVPPPLPGLPRPRFSLYLSSQLQYGVIVVYHRQCVILLEEALTIRTQLVKKRKSQKIDMDDHSKQTQLKVNTLAVQEETDWALAPFFGLMRFQETMPSPTSLIQHLGEASPGLSRAAASPQRGITASPGAITLRETPPVTFPAAEFEGSELAQDELHTLNLLIAERDFLLEGDTIAAREEEETMTREQERREGYIEREKTKELTGSTLKLQPTMMTSDDTLVPPEEMPDLEGPERPSPRADPPTPVLMSMPSSRTKRPRKQQRELPEGEAVPPPKEKRRKRQMIFFDQDTQLSQAELQAQIDDPLVHTEAPLLSMPPSHRMASAAYLLTNPCTLLPEEIRLLWRQAAIITPLPGSDLQVGERGPDSTDSEKSSDAAQRQEDEPSTTDVPRELESGLLAEDISGPLQLEGSDSREATEDISPLTISDRERLENIPEEVEEGPARVSAPSPGMLPEEFTGPDEAPVTLHSLLPPGFSRRSVSKVFWKLLEHVSNRMLSVEQVDPYTNIWISPGPDNGVADATV